MGKLKAKDVSEQLKGEIIEYAKSHSVHAASKKYNMWPDTIQYWISPDRARTSTKRYYHNKMEDDSFKEKRRQMAKINSNKHTDYYRQYRIDNKDRVLQRSKQHRADNIEEYKRKAAERYQTTGKHRNRERMKIDPVYKMKRVIRENLRRAIKRSNYTKTHPSIEYLGCDIEYFIQHIESKFQPGMSWDNHGRGDECWHLDHIEPLALITDITDIDTLKRLCHYTNYQPLWEKDNLSKQDKCTMKSSDRE